MRLSRLATAIFLFSAAPLFAGYRIAMWIEPWNSQALSSTQTNAGHTTESNPVWYTLDSAGNIVKTYKSEDPALLAAMTGTEIIPTLQNYVSGSGWSNSVVASIVNDPAKREAHANAITQLVIDKGYDGIDIDYEALTTSTRDNYSEFVRVLAGKLHTSGKKLSVTVAAKKSDSDTWAGPGGHDYAAIGAAADWAKLMAYDYSYDGSPAGPITPLDWLDQVVTYAESKMPSAKVIVGLPWFGHDWVGTSADTITYQVGMDRATANNATITHDSNGEATFTYGNHKVFFQDAYAYDQKTDRVTQRHPNVAGFAHWSNGEEDPAFWTRVDALKNGGAPATPAPPASPSNLNATAASTTTINLTWIDNATNEDGYRVERCAGAACTAFAQIAQLGPNTTSFTDSGLTASTSYSYRVYAYNAGGNSAYSNTATATTQAPPPPTDSPNLIATGSTWKYADNGGDQGTAWRSLSFDDGAWRSGAAQLGYGDGDERTVVSYGPSSTNKYITTYFRQTFSIADPTAYTALNLRVLRDDGAVVYLNGTEVWRTNMPTGTIGYRTLAASVLNAPEENTFYQTSVDPRLLVSGTNIVAVEIHQGDVTSSDISFDAELTGTVVTVRAPSGLSATATSSSSVNLTWTDNSSNESGFEIERCSGASCTTFAQIAQVAADVTTFTDVNLAASTSYSYRVRAFDATSNSAYSNTASATTQPPPPPAAPTALTAAAVSTSQINLSWTDNATNEDGFRVERCSDSVCTTATQIAQLAANVTTYSDAGLTASTTYSYRVVAYNSGGSSGYSNIATATTAAGPVTLVATGSTWKYLDNGTDQGTAWRTLTFSDGAWRSGAAQLGYGDGDERTVVSYGSSKNKYITTYFRRAFNVGAPTAFQSLDLRLLRDDGAVVYLNGTEVWRSNMPAGTIGYRTLAASVLNAPEESTFYQTTIDPHLLVAGTNVIAVEIHQGDVTSSDISFDLELTGN